MCLGLPGKIIEIKGKKAKISQGGHFHWVDVSAIGEKIKAGDYLLTYQDAAVNKISARQAKEILSLMHSAGDAGIKRSN